MEGSKIGLYFITTDSFRGRLTRWVLGTDYDTLGFQMESSLPMESPFVYIFDLFTFQNVAWNSNSLRLEEWKTLRYNDKNIYKILYSELPTSLSNYESIKLDIKKFMATHCFSSVKSTTKTYWNYILSNESFEISSYIPFLKYFKQYKVIYDYPHGNSIVPYSEEELFLSLLMDAYQFKTLYRNSSKEKISNYIDGIINQFNTENYIDNTSKDILELPKDTILVKKSIIDRLDTYIYQWCKTISSKGTVVIYINQILHLLHSLSKNLISPASIDKESSFQSIIISTSIDTPDKILLPKLTKNESYVISLSNPDLSLVPREQIAELEKILYSDEYLLNPLYDELRSSID